MNLKPETIEKLRKIRQTFAAELPGRLTDLKSAWQKYVGATHDTAVFDEANRAAHSLAGSAASFGFPDISEAARQLENLLADYPKKGSAPGVVAFQIEQLILAMQRMAAFQMPDQLDAREDKSAGHFVTSLNPIQEKLVFILEKDQTVARGLVGELANFGFIVRLFDDAGEMVSTLSKESPAILVLHDSLISSEVNAYLNRLAAANAKLPKIIVNSASDDFTHRMKAIQSGAHRFLSRPLQNNILVSQIESLLLYDEGQSFRILLVDDAENLTESYSVLLEGQGMLTRRISDGSQILAQMNEFRPDLIIMDLYMPGYSGIELAGLIRQIDDYVGIPIIFLSREVDTSIQLNAMQVGSEDFLSKPVDWERLVSIVRLRAERSRVLRERIARDGLTLLLNHSAIQEQIRIRSEEAKANAWPVSIAMIDIDDFKKINDTYGHVTGDTVIRTLASILGSTLRRTDKIGRYGGEEFLVIMPNTTATAAFRMIEILRENFRSIQFSVGGKSFGATFSAGVAELNGADEDIISRADKAMYSAKHAGKNQVVMAD